MLDGLADAVLELRAWDELINVRLQNRELSAELDHARKEVSGLTENDAGDETEVDELRDRVRDLVADNKAKDTEIRALNDFLATSRVQLGELREKNAVAAQRVRHLEDECSDFEIEQERYVDLEKKLEGAGRCAADWKTRYDNLVASAESDCATLRESIKYEATRCENLEAALAKFRDESNRLRSELKARDAVSLPGNREFRTIGALEVENKRLQEEICKFQAADALHAKEREIDAQEVARLNADL
jgi:chromosome segregation ATPase